MRISIVILAICISLLTVEAGWLDDLAQAASNAGNTTGEWAEGAAKDTFKAAQQAGKLTGDWVRTTGSDVLDGAGRAGKAVGGWIKETGQKIQQHLEEDASKTTA